MFMPYRSLILSKKYNRYYNRVVSQFQSTNITLNITTDENKSVHILAVFSQHFYL